MVAILKPAMSPLRVGRVTGSRIGAVLGLNPYSSRADVLREMVREAFDAPREFTGNDATRYGQAKEPEALAAYEAREGVMTYGGDDCLVHPAHDFLAVTPDGLVGEAGMIECKAPYRGTYTHWREKPYYEAQMRLQLECAGRDWCDFAVLDRAGVLHVSRLAHDPAWLPSVMPALESFMADYAAALADPTPHLADAERADAAWRKAAKAWGDAKRDADEAAERLDAAKAALLSLAGDAPAKGCGVTVIRSERAGSVAYAKALKDLAPDADLTPYTGKPSTVFSIKESAA
jgi:putative phage-type endonuclease